MATGGHGAAIKNKRPGKVLAASAPGQHLMKEVMSSSLRTARPVPAGREARVTRGRGPPDSQRDAA